MSTQAAARNLAIPAESKWPRVVVPELRTKLSDGTSVYVAAHYMLIAPSYPTFEDGELVANVTQAQVAQFLREYNEVNNTKFRYPMLFEDEAVRDQLGKDHPIFDENFERNRRPWRWGYVADFNKPYGNRDKGVNDQPLVTRLISWRLTSGDYEIGPVTIAPSGMVPRLSRRQFEEMAGAVGLRRLEQLRGREIYEADSQIVDVRNALGYPQFTLGHDAKDESGLIPHSYHVYTPNQNEPERVGLRRADWRRHDGLRCFYVDLGVRAGCSRSAVSVPLVRGGNLEAEVTRPSYKVTL